MADTPRITLPDVNVTPDEKPPEAQMTGVLSPGGALTAPPSVPAHDVQAASRTLGYSWDEIHDNALQHAAAASNVGYSQAEIDDHLGWPDPTPFREQQDQQWQDRLRADPSLADVLKPDASIQPLLGPEMRKDYAQALVDGHVKSADDFASFYVGALANQTVPAGEDPSKAVQDRVGEIAPELAKELPSHDQILDYSIALTHAAGLPLNPTTIATAKANLLHEWSGQSTKPPDIYTQALNDPDFHRRLVSAPPVPSVTERKPWEVDPVLQHFYAPEVLTPDEAQKQFQKRISGKDADKIEPFSMVGEPVNHGQSFAKFLEEAGVSTVELAAGGYVLGKAFQLGGRTLGYLWSKVLHLDPEAAAGKAMRPVPLDKIAEPDGALHDAAIEQSRRPAYEEPLAPAPKAEGEPEGPDPAKVQELAHGYRVTSGLVRWANSLDPEIVKNLQPFMFGGFGNLFRTPAKQAERTAFRDGRDFAERSLTKLYSLGSQEIAQFVHDLEPLRQLVNPHMGEWEREIAKGPAGAPMGTMIGNLVRYMQGRSTGVTLRADSPLAPVADMIRSINQAIEAKLRAYEAAGKINLTSYYQDYFRQMWENPAIADQVFSGATRQGSSASFKQRTHPTWEAGLAAGLKPKIADPIELTIYDVASKIRYLGAIDTRDEAVAAGHAYWAKSPAAGGDTELAGNLAQRIRSWVDPNTGKAHVMPERLYAGAGYARSFNNWHSKGMFSHPVSSNLYDNLMYASNTLTGLKLLNPIFHIRTVGLGSVASGVGQSLEELGRGQLLRAMGSLAGLPARPLTDYYAGAVAHKAYLDKALGNPVVQRLVEAGLSFGERPQLYKMSGAPNLWSSMMRRSLSRELGQDVRQIFGSDQSTALMRALRVPDRTVQFAIKEAGRVMSTLTGPVFDNFIPRMKAGAAMRRLESYLFANPTASEGAIEAKTRQIVKDVENREGELNMDTVFIPNMVKQILRTAMISTGWKYGSYRGFMSAAGFDVERGRWAWNPVALTSTIGTVVGYGAFNSIEQYLHTSTLPWQTDTPLLDAAFYRTGTTRARKPVRGMIPSELKEVVDLGRILAFSWGDPTAVPQATAEYALGAVNPFWQTVRAMVSGQDAIGHHIAQTPGGWPAFLKEQLLEPMSVTAEEQRKGDSGINWLETFLGDKEGPSWVENWDKYQAQMKGVRAKWTRGEVIRYQREQAATRRGATPDVAGTAAAPGGSQSTAEAFKRAMQGQQ